MRWDQQANKVKRQPAMKLQHMHCPSWCKMSSDSCLKALWWHAGRIQATPAASSVRRSGDDEHPSNNAQARSPDAHPSTQTESINVCNATGARHKGEAHTLALQCCCCSWETHHVACASSYALWSNFEANCPMPHSEVLQCFLPCTFVLRMTQDRLSWPKTFWRALASAHLPKAASTARPAYITSSRKFRQRRITCPGIGFLSEHRGQSP